MAPVGAEDAGLGWIDTAEAAQAGASLVQTLFDGMSVNTFPDCRKSITVKILIGAREQVCFSDKRHHLRFLSLKTCSFLEQTSGSYVWSRGGELSSIAVVEHSPWTLETGVGGQFLEAQYNVRTQSGLLRPTNPSAYRLPRSLCQYRVPGMLAFR